MTDSASQPTKTSSSTRTIIIVVVAVIILAGGGFVVYKLTNKKDVGTPAVIVAQTVRKAADTGNQATIDKYTTAQGKAEVALLKGKLSGVKFAQCGPAPFVKDKTKLCTFTQPGGQLALLLTPSKGSWLVSSAKFGPVAVTPTT